MYQSTTVIVVAALVAAVPVGVAAQVAGPAPRVTSAGVRAAAPAQASIGGRVVTPNGQVLVNTTRPGPKPADWHDRRFDVYGGRRPVFNRRSQSWQLRAGDRRCGRSGHWHQSVHLRLGRGERRDDCDGNECSGQRREHGDGSGCNSHVNRRGERQVCGGRSRRRRHGHTRKRRDGQSVPVSRSDTTGLREGSSP